MGGNWQRLLGIGFLVAAAWSAHRSWEYRTHGVVVEGVVVRVDAKVAVDDGALDHSVRPVVVWRRVDDGTEHRLEGMWSSPLLFGYDRGDRVKVRYLPGEADAARQDSLLVDWGLPVIFLVLGVSGLGGRLRSGRGEYVIWRGDGD